MKALLPFLCLLHRSIPVRFRHLVSPNLRHAVREPRLLTQIHDAPLWFGNLDSFKMSADDTSLRFVE